MVVWALDLMCNYIKLHIFVSRFTNFKLVAAIYAAAFGATHPGETEPEFDSLAQFIENIGDSQDSVLEYLRKKFQDDAPVIVGGLELLMSSYDGVSNFDVLRKKNTFELLQLSSEAAKGLAKLSF